MSLKMKLIPKKVIQKNINGNPFRFVCKEKVYLLYTENLLKKFLSNPDFTGILTVDIETGRKDNPKIGGNRFLDDIIIAVGLSLKLKNGNWSHGIINLTDSAKCNTLNNKIVGIVLREFYKNVKRTIAHNFNFEFKFFWKHYDIYMDGYHRADTIVSAHLLNENRFSFELDLLSKEVGVVYEKEESNYGKIFGSLDEEKQIQYLGKDIIATARLFDKHEIELEKEGLRDIYYNIEMLFNWTLGLMEWNGIDVDVEKAYDTFLNINHLQRRIDKTLKKLAGCNDFNVLSGKQLSDILYTKLKLVPFKYGNGMRCNVCGKNLNKKTNYLCKEHGNNVSKVPAADKEVLTAFALQGDKFCETLLEYRSNAKLNSTYIKPIRNLVYSDGKIHTSYKQHGTISGRIASVNPNSQNFPAGDKDVYGVRSMFVAPKGWIFIDGDYSQLEPRLQCHFSEDPVLTETYLNDKDLYSYGAVKMFKKPYEECGEGTFERKATKTIALGLSYGMGINSLAKRLNIEYSQAKELFYLYINTYAGVYGRNGYKKWLLEEAKKNNGVIHTLLGRKRRVKEIFSDDDGVRSYGERAVFNSKVQGSAADIMRILQIRFYQFFSKEEVEKRIKMVFQIHDELLFLCLEERADEYIKRIKHIAEDFSDINLKLKCPLKFNIHKGYNWKEAK